VATAYKPKGGFTAVKYIIGSEVNINELVTGWVAAENDLLYIPTTDGGRLIAPGDYVIQYPDGAGTYTMTAAELDLKYEVA